MHKAGRFIASDSSNAARAFYAIREMYCDLINKPTVNQYGRLGPDTFDNADLETANTLLAALEKCFDLRVVREGASPRSAGLPTEEMVKDYVKMKHWQDMLNRLYGPQEASSE